MRPMTFLLATAVAGALPFLVGVAHAARIPGQQISVSVLAPAKLGATSRARWPGSKDRIPYLGTTRLNWAYVLKLSSGSHINQAVIRGIAPVHLFLDDGRCVALVPKIVNGQAMAATAAPEACPPTPDADQAITSRSSEDQLIGSSVGPDLTVWSRRKGATSVIRTGKSGPIVTRLPIRARALGSLPELHHGGTDMTIFGDLGGSAVVINVTVPRKK
jgi:hypothetical protein